MKFNITQGLPVVSANVTWNRRSLHLETVLLDTGSAGTIFSADKLADIGLVIAPDDVIRQVYGVGGMEFVFMSPTRR